MFKKCAVSSREVQFRKLSGTYLDFTDAVQVTCQSFCFRKNVAILRGRNYTIFKLTIRSVQIILETKDGYFRTLSWKNFNFNFLYNRIMIRMWPPWTILIELQAEVDLKPVIFFLCIIVRVVFCLWAFNFNRVARKVPRFGAGIVWRTIPSGFPVFWFVVPGCSRNSYGTSPNLWVQKKLVKFW